MAPPDLHPPLGRPSRAPRDLFGVFVAVALLVSGCSKKEASEPERIVTVSVAPVLKAAIQRKVTANGVLYPLRQAAIVPKISAPVKKFYVERGSRVQAGQLLAELENEDLAAAVTESRGGYEQAQANFEVASRGTVPEAVQKAELDLKGAQEALTAAQKLYESRQALFQQGAIAQKEVQDSLVSLTQARNQYDIAQKHLQSSQGFGREQELKAAAGQLAAAKGRYENAAAQLNYSKIFSPIDGVVTDRPIYPGEMASGGAPILTVMDLSEVIARVHIAQQEAALLKAGDAAALAVPGQEGAVRGKVSLVSPALDPNSTTVEVWVQAANPGERLKAGAGVRVEAVAETVSNALVVPRAAVLTGSDGATSVMVVDAANKPHKKSVKAGIRDGEQVQITAGLEGGERVVTVGAFELDKLDEDVLAKTKLEIQAAKDPQAEEEGK